MSPQLKEQERKCVEEKEVVGRGDLKYRVPLLSYVCVYSCWPSLPMAASVLTLSMYVDS